MRAGISSKRRRFRSPAKPDAAPTPDAIAPAAPDWSHVVEIVKWSVTAVVALGVLFFAMRALKAAKSTLAEATADAAPKGGTPSRGSPRGDHA
jgi:hypothetical protein